MLEKIILTWGNPLELHRDQETILLAKCFNEFVLFVQLYIFIVYTNLNSQGQMH